MKITISGALTFIWITFTCVGYVNMLNINMAMQKVNDYHYATVHEIESSDFSPYVIEERKANSDYTTTITNKSSKEDLRIYQVETKATLHMPLFGYSKEYVKESIAR